MNNSEQQKLALIIGNNDYKNCPLKNCVNDAKDVSAALKYIGFRVTTITNLNYGQMFSEVRDFIASIQPHSFVVFFFSGHGMQYKNENYLIPCDNDKIKDVRDLKYNAPKAQEILENMSEKNPFVILCLLDCCRTYTLPRIPGSKSLGMPSRGMAVMQARAGMLIAHACAPGAVADDVAPNGRNGIFTYHLLKNIDKPGEDIMMLLRDVSDGVVTDTNGLQIPHITSSLTKRNVCLVPQNKGIAVAENPDSLQQSNSSAISGAYSTDPTTESPLQALMNAQLAAITNSSPLNSNGTPGKHRNNNMSKPSINTLTEFDPPVANIEPPTNPSGFSRNPTSSYSSFESGQLRKDTKEPKRSSPQYEHSSKGPVPQHSAPLPNRNPIHTRPVDSSRRVEPTGSLLSRVFKIFKGNSPGTNSPRLPAKFYIHQNPLVKSMSSRNFQPCSKTSVCESNERRNTLAPSANRNMKSKAEDLVDLDYF